MNRHQNMFWVGGGPGPSCGKGDFPIIQFISGSLSLQDGKELFHPMIFLSLKRSALLLLLFVKLVSEGSPLHIHTHDQ